MMFLLPCGCATGSGCCQGRVSYCPHAGISDEWRDHYRAMVVCDVLRTKAGTQPDKINYIVKVLKRIDDFILPEDLLFQDDLRCKCFKRRLPPPSHAHT